MANVLLIKPWKKNRKLIFEHIHPLGIMYIASYIRQRGDGYNVKIIDMVVERRDYDDIRDEIRGFNPDIVGISALIPESQAANLVAEGIKQDFDKCRIIMGGPYATASPEKALRNSSADFAVIGEGEETMLELLEKICNGENCEEVRGIAFIKNGAFVRTEPRPYIEDLDSLPFPAWDLIQVEKYYSSRIISLTKTPYHKRYMSIFSSRGCPYQCAFCHNIFGKRFRYRSVENLFSEIETLSKKYDLHEVHIIDDSFNINKSRVIDLCERIKESGLNLKISFPNGLRGDILNEEIIDSLVDAGLYSSALGIESGSEKIQKAINKNVDFNKLTASINYLNEKGVIAHGFFMLGFPGETKEDIMQTIAYARDSKLDSVGFHSLVPFEGTPLYESVLEKKNEAISFKSNASYKFDDLDVNISAVGTKEIKKLVRKAYWSFYGSFRRLWRIWSMSHSKIYLIKVIFYFIAGDKRLFKIKKT